MLIRMSIYGGGLILLILVLRFLAVHRLPKKLFVLLWDIALLRLLFPVSIPVRLVFSPVKKVTDTVIQKAGAGRSVFVLWGNGKMTAEAVVGHSRNSDRMFLFWLLGTVVLFFIFTFRYWKEYGKIKEALPLSEKEEQEIRTLAGIPKWIKLRKSDRILTPLASGIFSPKIILSSALQIIDINQLKYVMVHELVHIRRADNLRKILMSVVVCLHWCNPFVWVMYYFYHCDLELACDERVISFFGETVKEDYAMTLVALAESKTGAALFFSGFGKNAVKERIVGIMKFKKLTAFTSAVAVLIAGTALTVFAQNTEAEKGTEEIRITAEQTEVSGNPDVSKETGTGEEMEPYLSVASSGSVKWDHEKLCTEYEFYYHSKQLKGTYTGKPVAGIYDCVSGTTAMIRVEDPENAVFLKINEDGEQTEITRQEFFKLSPDSKKDWEEMYKH